MDSSRPCKKQKKFIEIASAFQLKGHDKGAAYKKLVALNACATIKNNKISSVKSTQGIINKLNTQLYTANIAMSYEYVIEFQKTRAKNYTPFFRAIDKLDCLKDKKAFPLSAVGDEIGKEVALLEKLQDTLLCAPTVVVEKSELSYNAADLLWQINEPDKKLDRQLEMTLTPPLFPLVPSRQLENLSPLPAQAGSGASNQKFWNSKRRHKTSSAPTKQFSSAKERLPDGRCTSKSR